MLDKSLVIGDTRPTTNSYRSRLEENKRSFLREIKERRYESTI
jgi:hypothetical protein